MVPLASPHQNSIVSSVHQSAPVDLTAPIDPSTLAGKTILITGGATGLGAGFARRWASHGAHVLIGDINDDNGTALVAELRSSSSNSSVSSSSSSHHHHFIHVDVTDWASQVHLFQEAVRLSPTGGLDAVVVSAGVGDKEGTITGKGFENPVGLDQPNPPPPGLACLKVNLIGTMYSAHLALFWLQKNRPAATAAAVGGPQQRQQQQDRHLLLVGSSAGLSFLPGVPEYVTSKHGVTGLFRSLRTLSYRQGIRVNLLCPYFVDTPILPSRALVMLAGMGITRLDDTVDAATRLMVPTGPHGGAAPPAHGRALLIGPRISTLRKVLPDGEVGDGDGDEDGEDDLAKGQDIFVEDDYREGRGQAIWDVYGHDYETVDFFIRRYIRLLNTIAAIKGWVGWFKDLYHTLFVRKDPAAAKTK